MSNYIQRSIEPVLNKAVQQFPAVILTGPRQAGKTTLLQKCLGSSHRYVSLETPDVRAAAAADPRGFLDLNPAPVIFDEIQHAPDLLFYLSRRKTKEFLYSRDFFATSHSVFFQHSRITSIWAPHFLNW